MLTRAFYTSVLVLLCRSMAKPSFVRGIYMALYCVSLPLFSIRLLVLFEIMATEPERILMELELITVEQQLVFLKVLQDRNERRFWRRWSVCRRLRGRSQNFDAIKPANHFLQSASLLFVVTFFGKCKSGYGAD